MTLYFFVQSPLRNILYEINRYEKINTSSNKDLRTEIIVVRNVTSCSLVDRSKVSKEPTVSFFVVRTKERGPCFIVTLKLTVCQPVHRHVESLLGLTNRNHEEKNRSGYRQRQKKKKNTGSVSEPIRDVGPKEGCAVSPDKCRDLIRRWLEGERRRRRGLKR